MVCYSHPQKNNTILPVVWLGWGLLTLLSNDVIPAKTEDMREALLDLRIPVVVRP